VKVAGERQLRTILRQLRSGLQRLSQSEKIKKSKSFFLHKEEFYNYNKPLASIGIFKISSDRTSSKSKENG